MRYKKRACKILRYTNIHDFILGTLDTIPLVRIGICIVQECRFGCDGGLVMLEPVKLTGRFHFCYKCLCAAVFLKEC